MSPPSYVAQYEDGKTETFNFVVIQVGPPTYIELSADGFLSEYVTLSTSNFTLEANSKKEISATITYPEYSKITEYGKQKLKILAEEKPMPGTVGMGAVTAVRGVIVIEVPTPGEYGKITNFKIESVEKGQDTELQLILTNKGTFPLVNKKAQVTIYDSENNKIDEFNFNNLNIPIKESKEIIEPIISSKYVEGKYKAEATFTFSNEITPHKLTTEFFIGKTDIVLEDYTRNVTRGEVSKINLKFQSIWGSPLSGVRTYLTFNKKTDQLPVLDFMPFGKSSITTYLDVPETAGSQVTADLEIKVPVENGFEEKIVELNFDVLEPIEQNEKYKNTSSTMLVYISFVILLILILITFNIYLITKTKKEKKEE